MKSVSHLVGNKDFKHLHVLVKLSPIVHAVGGGEDKGRGQEGAGTAGRQLDHIEVRILSQLVPFHRDPVV